MNIAALCSIFKIKPEVARLVREKDRKSILVQEIVQNCLNRSAIDEILKNNASFYKEDVNDRGGSTVRILRLETKEEFLDRLSLEIKAAKKLFKILNKVKDKSNTLTVGVAAADSNTEYLLFPKPGFQEDDNL